MRKGGLNMFKCTKWLAAALAALILVAAPVSAQTPYYFWWQVVDEQGRPFKSQTAGVGDVSCSVYRPNIHGAAVLHSNASLSNIGRTDPLFSDLNGRLHFYSTSADPVDVTCTAEYGGFASVAKLDRFTHKIVVPRDASTNITKFPVNSIAVVYQGDAGASLPGGALVRDVIIQNLSPITGQSVHVSVGFLGNHIVGVSNSLLNAYDVTSNAANAPEWKRATYTSAQVSIATHRGTALILSHGSTQTYEVPYLVHVDTGLSLSYSTNATTASAARVHVFIIWNRFHTGVNRQPAGQ